MADSLPLDTNETAPKLTGVQWLICAISAIGFAFDIYTLLMLPLIIKPAMLALGGPSYAPGSPDFKFWGKILFFVPAIAGGIFGLLGGYLTDILGRRRVLTGAILLYAFSAMLAGFANSLFQLLLLRCGMFIGVSVEFVAAVAWLAELFPNAKQREKVLGFTQAFSSFGGMMVAGSNILAATLASRLPAIYGSHEAWRYTLISGVIPALPLILIRPFLPESPVWQKKKEAGILKRPSIAELFSPALRKTTILTTIVFASSYGIAFGAIQQLPLILGAPKGGHKEIAAISVEKAKTEIEEAKMLEKAAAEAGALAKQLTPATSTGPAASKPTSVPSTLDAHGMTAAQAKAAAAKASAAAAVASRKAKVAQSNAKDKAVAEVSGLQEIGGLFGRIALAFLALMIASRRGLLAIFAVPALIIVPCYFWWVSGNLQSDTLGMIKIGIFVVGFFVVSQFSFWGNYIPLVFPLHLRGTGESFAANIGGRILGTMAAWLTISFAGDKTATPIQIAQTAAIVAGSYALIGVVLSYWLPEPHGKIQND